MAIGLPSVARVTSAPMRIIHPFQTTLRSQYTRAEQVLGGSGPGVFRGSHTISGIGVDGADPRPAMEAFIDSLQGQRNTMLLPVHRPSGGNLAAGTALSVASSSSTGGVLSVVCSGGAAGGLVRGDIVSIGGHCYRVLSDMLANGTIGLIPDLPVDDNADVVWEDVKVTARLTEESADDLADYTPDAAGPWELEWVEVA